jgi:hypothetical protein
MTGRPARAWQLLRLGWARGGRAAGVLDVWLGWERFLEWRQRIRPVRPGAVLRYSLTRHRGRLAVLRDGTAVRRGDPIVELHFDNRRLVELMAAGTTPWVLLRLFRDDLSALRRAIAGGRLGRVMALHGVTMFAPATARLGFEVRPLRRTWRLALVRFFMAGLVVLYHPAGWSAARRHAGRWPAEVWMSAAVPADRPGAGGDPAA